MENSKPKIHYAWWILVVCFAMNMLVHALTFSVAGLYVKPVSESMGVARSIFSLQDVATAVAAIIVAPIWGRLYRKYDMRKLLAFCTVMTASTIFMRSFAPNVIVIILLGFFKGIFLTGNTVLPNSILITSWFGKSRGMAIGTASIGISVGSAIFNPLIQSIITNFGWRSADRFTALIIVAIMVPLVLIIIRATPKEKGLQPFGIGTVDAKSDTKSDNANESKLDYVAADLTVKEARTKLAFYVYLFIAFSLTFVYGAWLQLSQFLTDVGYSPAAAANAIALFSIISIFGKFAIGFLFDRLKLKTSSKIIFVAGIGAFVCLMFARNIIALNLALVLWGFAGGVTNIMLPLWTSSIFGTMDYGSIYGYVLSINRLGGVIGSFLVSLLFDLTGSNDLIWPICVVVMILSMFGILYCFSEARKWSIEKETEKELSVA